MSLTRRTYRTLIIIVVAALPVVAGAALFLAGGRAKPQMAPPPPPQVTVAEVIHRPLRQWQEFTGRLQAIQTVQVQPRVGGYIDRVAFTDGAPVSKGTLLFQIDPRPFQAEVNRLTAERARAAAQLHLAEANYRRGTRLLASNAISRQDYESLGATQSSDEAALSSVDSQLREARLNLEFTQVRAPISGHASRALITAGNLVNSDSVLTTVVSDNPIYAYFDVDERTYLRYAQLGRGRRGDAGAAKVFMGLIDEQGYPHQGRLDFIDNRIDPATGTIRARAVFANADGRYTPGLFARIRLVGGPLKKATLIQDRAIGTDLGKKFVLAVTPHSEVEYRPVKLGPEIDGLRVIEQGLADGDVVVVDGLQHVRPGQTVKPAYVAMAPQDDGALRQITASSETASTAVADRAPAKASQP